MKIKKESEELKKKNVLWLAQKNMGTKKTRVRFTILAMVFGVGFLVILISIGYGLQRLVINQIASLQSLKTADITSEDSKKLKIEEETIEDFKNIQGVEKVEPLIALVGKAEFKGSYFDVGVFGTTKNYLDLSDIDSIEGSFYDSNDISYSGSDIFISESINTETKEENNKISFNIKEGEWVKVREEPNLKARVLGYTKKQDSWILGDSVSGGKYLARVSSSLEAKASNLRSEKWLVATVPIWQRNSKGSMIEILEEDGSQKTVMGYFGENFIDFSPEKVEAKTQTTNEEIIPGESSGKKDLPKLAVVNEAVVNLLGFTSKKDIIGKLITINVILPSQENNATAKESKLENFKVVSVISGIENPQVYIPFINLRALNINEFSQLKIEVDNKENLSKIRKQIETMGFQTASVADTVDRVSQVFKWINIGLFVIGSIALIIATIGMFNTLTVSLLERTREIGIMKAIGMKRKEVMFLFFFEAGLMGFWGGIIGFAAGFMVSEIFNLLINLLFIPPAKRFIFLISIPWYLPFFVIFFTILISLLTAIMPAQRASRISPLNAIRYE